MTRVFHALSEFHLISCHGMVCSIPLELHHSIRMLIYIYDRVQVNIACAFMGVIASVGVSLLGMTHPLWENISGARYTLVDDSHLGPRG